MTRLAVLALVCGALASTGIAQEKKSLSNDPPLRKPQPQRAHYVVRNADPVVLAEVVGKHFKDEAEIIAAPAGSGNAILVSGSLDSVAAVVKLLEALDRKARSIEVEIVLVDVPIPKEGKVVALRDNLLDDLDALAKAGPAQRIKVTAVEGQQVISMIAGDKPIASNDGIDPKGFVGRPSINYRQLGTTVKFIARLKSDDAVSLELNLEESKVRSADAGDGAVAPSFDKTTLTTTVNVPAGKAVAAQSVQTDGKAGTTMSVVIVTARVVDDRPANQAK